MLQHAIFIIRGYNKTAEDFSAFQDRFNVLEDAIKRHVIAYEIMFATPDDMITIPASATLPLRIVRTEKSTKEQPNWTQGLNAPIQELLGKKYPPSTAVIPYSFETHLDETNAEKLTTLISENKRFLACRITPDWLNADNPYSTKTEDDVLQRWEYVQTNVKNSTLSNILRDEKRLQTLCMLGRNTLAHNFLSDFITNGLFDETTDALGGMEDWEYLLRILPTFEHVIFYSDIRIKENEQDTGVIEYQRVKLQREIGALKKIIERLL